MKPLVPLVVLALLPTLAARPAVAAPQASLAATPVFKNLGHAIFIGERLDGDLVAFLAHEAHQGGTDLNGDGDASDGVLHTYRFSTGAVQNAQIAGSGDPILDAGLVFVEVLEFQQGSTDLNGDGDTSDGVLHLFEPATGTVTNLGLAIAGIPRLHGTLLGFIVDESDQGADLNGDGDTNDNVLHTYEHTAATVTNHGIAVLSGPFVHGKFASFGASEPGEGVDLNGDGDVQDIVQHVLNASTGTITNVGLHQLTSQIGPRMVSFWVFEPAQGGQDLNGDGDGADRVMHVVDLSTMAVTNTGLAVNVGSLLEGTRVAFLVPEADQAGTDLNGDGDATDAVMHAFDVTTGTTANLGLAVAAFDFSGPRLAMGVLEGAQGATDLNGDTDTSDQVLHLFDFVTGTLQNLGLANQAVRIEGRDTAFEVIEGQQGGADLNGDGDALDVVLHVHRAGALAATNVGLALGGSFLLEPNRVLFPVSEIDQGGLDRNNDGDALDAVLASHRIAPSLTLSYRLAVGISLQLEAKRAAIPVIEADQGGTDLNGDGDTLDLVLWVANGLP